MANRCRPGDLAIVIKAQHKSNLGRIVKILARHDRTGPVIYGESIVVWLAECSAPMKWTWGSKVYKLKRGPIPDEQLQPIRKRPADRRVKQQTTVLEPA